MSEPHFFVRPGFVINLARVLYARPDGSPERGRVYIDTPAGTGIPNGLLLEDDDWSEFMLMAARYHHFQREEKWPSAAEWAAAVKATKGEAGKVL